MSVWSVWSHVRVCGLNRAIRCSAVTRFTVSNSWKFSLQMESTAKRSSDVDKFRLSLTTAALGGGPVLDPFSSRPGPLGPLGPFGPLGPAVGSVGSSGPGRREVP